MAVVLGQVDFRDDLKLNLFRKGSKKIYVNETILKKQSEMKNYIRSVCFCSNDIDTLKVNLVIEEHGLIKLYLNLNQYIQI